MYHTIICTQIFERRGTLHNSKKSAQIKTLPAIWWDKENLAKRKTLTPNSPSLLVLSAFPREMLWELLVCVLTCKDSKRAIICIGFKERGEASALGSSTLEKLLWILAWVICDQVLPGKMYLNK
jgi:hypothetical protein